MRRPGTGTALAAGALVTGTGAALMTAGAIVLSGRPHPDLWSNAWSATGLGMTAFGLTVPVSYILLGLFLDRRKPHDATVASPARLVDVSPHGKLPHVCDLDPYSLGASPSRYGNADSYGQCDVYVPRGQDEFLAEALRSGHLVVLAGPSKAGKSRTAFEVLRAHPAWDEALVAVPRPGALDQLAVHSALSGAGAAVIWLDDLHRFLPPAGDLSQAVIQRMVARSGPTLLLGTLRSEQRHLLCGNQSELTRDVRMVLDGASWVELGSTRDDPGEQARAAAVYPELKSLGGPGRNTGQRSGTAAPLP